ncbi:MAG: permease [Nanoarchaeota archaeon]|nr:permease [Nanoarchaeota archaeon]
MIHKTKNIHHKWFLAAIIIAVIIALITRPDITIKEFAERDYSPIINILLYLPGFFILMGLFEIWLPEKFIAEHLGNHSGISGAFYSFLFGTIIPGPLYVAFPIAAMLIKKGISRYNVALFIGAWSSIKIGEEIFEFQFMGLKFMLLRLLFTIPFVILSSFVIDRVQIKTKSESD